MTDTAGELSEREIASLISFYTGMTNGCVDKAARAIIDRLRTARSADADMIERARAEERERCAVIAESWGSRRYDPERAITKLGIARAIRAMEGVSHDTHNG